MAAHLKKFWITYGALIMGVLYAALPVVQSWVAAHPTSTVSALLLAVIAAFHSTAPKDAMRVAGLLLLSLVLCGGSFAQTATPTPAPAAPVTNNFSFTANAISLPGGGQTTAGALAGVTLNITPNFALRQTNFVATGSSTSGFFGGANYTIAPFSKWLNNISPNLDGYNFQLYLTASAGLDRITTPTTTQHWAMLAGGGLNYKLSTSGTYNLLLEVQYAKLPGFANNTVIVSAGPVIHF